jgi:hypothetical protein
MSRRTELTARLHLEDFRRLGVRPHEFRLEVIRNAVLRCAPRLARQHLDAPTSQSELQLSRVLTSTYRLMDPRRRADVTHRAYVGRVLPESLERASQTGFQIAVAETENGSRSSANDPFAAGTSLTADQVDLTSVPRLLESFQPSWVAAFSDLDLLHSRPMLGRVSRWYSSSWLSTAATGIIAKGATVRLRRPLRQPAVAGGKSSRKRA